MGADSVAFCVRVMVGVIILYDHVHKDGAFAKGSRIDVSIPTCMNYSAAGVPCRKDNELLVNGLMISFFKKDLLRM